MDMDGEMDLDTIVLSVLSGLINDKVKTNNHKSDNDQKSMRS